MNKLTKKLSLIVTSVLLSASIAMTPVAAASSRGKKYTQGNSATTNPAAGTLEEVTDLAAADTSSLISENYLNESQSSTLTGEHYVIVSLEGKSLSDRTNGDVTEYLDSFAGSAAAAEIEAEQSAFLRRLSAANVPYEYKYAYNTVANAVAVKIDVKYLSDVKKISGVDEVTVSEYYYAPQDIDVQNETNVWGTGIYKISDKLRAQGYDGSGMVVAVLDTGLDYSHAAFQTMPTAKAGVAMLDKATVKSSIFNGDTSKGLISKNKTVTVDDVYYNAKVPFAYDYADNDPDVYPSYSHHGTHVAGIIAGTPILDDDGVDQTIKDQDGNEILDKDGNPMTFTGVAPNAQLAIFKVFTDNEEEDGLGGAETVNILCALEDCVKLKVDVINMSLGSSAGFSTADNDF
ncbi:MAG: S8 family serine peptidase, partial [Firmicutes bacterium]|nr:S8 family serine peptidase [Bacillota bacterium]